MGHSWADPQNVIMTEDFVEFSDELKEAVKLHGCCGAEAKKLFHQIFD